MTATFRSRRKVVRRGGSTRADKTYWSYGVSLPPEWFHAHDDPSYVDIYTTNTGGLYIVPTSETKDLAL